MKTVILVVGRRGAGKTTFTSLVKQHHPEIGVIHFDQYFRENFSDWDFDMYSGDSHIANEILSRHITDVLHSHKHRPLLFDSWLPTPSRRIAKIARMFSLGAERVICWHVIAPPDVCNRQFAQREFNKKAWRGYSFEDLVRVGRGDNSHFEPTTDDEIAPPDHSNLDLDVRWDKASFRFDSIRMIDPAQLVFPNMPLI